ncbi:AraC family transcriptional regulator, partial [Mycobacterium rhizamassiliense]
VFVGSQVPHWDFPRNTASAALMTEFGCANGLAAADLLQGSGLAEADLHDHDRMIVGRQELAVVTNLVNLLGDASDLGVRVGSSYHAGSLGIFGFACLTSSTLGDAVRFAARFYELSYGFCLPTVTVAGPVAALRLDLPDLTGPVAEFLLRRDLAAIARVMAELLGTAVPFTAVEFAGPAPASGDAAARGAFGVPPRYGSTVNAASFPAALLGKRLPQASEMSVTMCEQQCRALLERRLVGHRCASSRRARTGVARRVRERLASIDGEPRTIAAVARRLAMSERTLRRRLAEENTTFRELVEEVHRVLAEELLATGALSVEDVALRLGYAEATSFIAAFKRWTGTTPARYQRSVAPRARRLAG